MFWIWLSFINFFLNKRAEGPMVPIYPYWMPDQVRHGGVGCLVVRYLTKEPRFLFILFMVKLSVGG
ncbi:hypothetical protein JY97_10155 [Alkalispirochaeta odontotermitis]|nr:hypothetical protein JY97_10155 [Alkalispirochaeta odontotermitis]